MLFFGNIMVDLLSTFQVFSADKSALCCFLNDEFHYQGRDWRSGETCSVSKTESIDYTEKLKLDELKKIPVTIPP